MKPVQIVITRSGDNEWKVAVMSAKATEQTFTLKKDFVASSVRRLIENMDILPNGKL